MRTKRYHRYGLGWVLIAGLFDPSSVLAATPPPYVNYQGVLRDQNDAPLSGSFDIVLRFMDAESGGNEILVDEHTLANSNAVIVEDGLFNVALGSGTVSDGSGPGTYVSLEEVFRDHADVWLEVSVGAETLSPRTRIHSSPYALNTAHLEGQPASEYLDTFTPFQAKLGRLELFNPDDGYAALTISSPGDGGTGILSAGQGVGVAASGGTNGGYFHGGQSYGVYGEGGIAGGRFVALGSGAAYGVHVTSNLGTAGLFGSTGGLGVRAIGLTGSEFATFASGMTVKLAQADYGVEVSGGGAGSTGVLATAGSYGGNFSANDSGSTGVSATGQAHGGFFQNAGAEYAHVASQGVAISGGGPTAGSYFFTGSPWFSYTYVPYAGSGIIARGSGIGGEFYNFQNSNYALASYSSYKILGLGAVSFVQNHPEDPSKVIVYASPEGDEVAVYTRGSGRLVDGEARVKLGETFARVTNPDIGLTATATPRGEPIPLAVDELGTGEMIVRGPAGSNAAFDYMVWGLRIGFEEHSIVQPKQRESKIPSMHDHEEFFQQDPALRGYTALARFADVEEKVRGRSQVNLERAHRLRDAVGVFPKGSPLDEPKDGPGRLEQAPPPHGVPSAPTTPDSGEQRPAPRPVAAPSGASTPQPQVEHDLFDIVGQIVAGDVLSLVAGSPGAVARSAGPDDALVIGCALESEAAAPGRIAVATSRIALCRVDASFGAVAVGDRLTGSPVPGTAMRATPDAAATAVLGRAIDPLEAGADVVRVLLGTR